MGYSPSCRTASTLVTDWESEAVGLIVIINLTGREYSLNPEMSHPSSLFRLEGLYTKG